ncbi:putative uncharacterized protein DDB_G0286901 [Episyrphus balteatus]|uniref:putative uncharacterized protein DDB_G0286901 n=1 Tax=Episyrphus balteatus TaxID=286459 RepID=UPI0024854051|nr:putative uncharacterized protein DDB_G0286901 [Episyrphus balteatus]
MDDAMDMSLDDYINSFKKMKNEQQPNANNINRSEESKFKEGRREQNDEEANDDLLDELTLQCQEDDYVSLALDNNGLNDTSIEEIEREPEDLRNKIAGRFPQSSQQWRLMQPNIMNVRPAGMPPLCPSDVPHQNGLSGGGNGYRHRWRNHHRRRNNYGNNGNWSNNNNYRNNNNNNQNGRIQRFNNNSRNNLNRQVLGENYPQKPTLITLTQLCYLFNSYLLGVSEIGIRNDMMPALAGKLLDFINGASPTMHKPIYDMKIQKEIHEIQKKPLLYKCPGGEVVSSDGVGIPDCKIQPKVSGISLNNRFA